MKKSKKTSMFAGPDGEHNSSKPRRLRSPHGNNRLISIKMGDFYVTKKDEVISTVLGSCVSACVRDRENGIGGINHFMLPTFSIKENNTWEYTSVNAAMRYGSYAMEHLINTILEQGGKRNNLEFKLFGGGDILGSFTSIGMHNVRFIRSYMKTEGYSVAAECLGLTHPIKLNYFPRTGVAKIKRLDDQAVEIAAVEKDFLHRMEETRVEGDITIFK